MDRLVIQNAQAFMDGIGPMSMVPDFLRKIGVRVLGARGTRKMANEMGYFDKSFANKDATDVSCVHVENPGEDH